MLEREAKQQRHRCPHWTLLLRVGTAEQIQAQVPYIAVDTQTVFWLYPSLLPQLIINNLT